MYVFVGGGGEGGIIANNYFISDRYSQDTNDLSVVQRDAYFLFCHVPLGKKKIITCTNTSGLRPSLS